MIRKLNSYELRPLSHVSPSQYYSALKCPYKLVLANSFGYEPLLPMNANAHFGSITHKMIELISRELIVDEESFSENWGNLIGEKENELKSKGLSNILPLKYFVTDFALKKNQLRNILHRKKDKIGSHKKTSTTNYYTEKRLANSDKSMIGVADLILKNNTRTLIIDFKTGKIYSESIDESGNIERILKKEYDYQLKLYAYLYFLMNQEYPTALFLVTLENDFIEVPFTKEDCQSIYMEAIAFLSATNTFIKKGEFESIAKPSEENCKYCSFRPACSFYSKWLIENFQYVNDLTGILKRVTLFNNNSLGLQLHVNGEDVLINGLASNLKEAFENLLTKNVTLYNLRKTKQSFNATANNFTIAYE